MVAVWPGCRAATLVFRQNRSLAYAAGTCSEYEQQFTIQSWPVSVFSGCPPSPGGLNRGSRQAPVQVGGSAGSVWRLSRLSLYVISVRLASLPYWLAAHRVFHHIRLPAKNARLTPAFLAAVTLARSPLSQYSECPEFTNTLCCSSIAAAPGADTSSWLT